MSKCRAQSPSVHDRAICLNGLLTEKASCFSSPPTTRHMRYGTRDIILYHSHAEFSLLIGQKLLIFFKITQLCSTGQSTSLQWNSEQIQNSVVLFNEQIWKMLFIKNLWTESPVSAICKKFSNKGNSSRMRTRTFPMQCIILY